MSEYPDRLTDDEKELYEQLWNDLLDMYRFGKDQDDNGIPFRMVIEKFMCNINKASNKRKEKEMRTRVKIDKTASEMKQVKTVWDEEEANVLLAKGWYLMHAGIAHQGKAGYQAKPVYVLARD